jgi:hypothetical protein
VPSKNALYIIEGKKRAKLFALIYHELLLMEMAA